MQNLEQLKDCFAKYTENNIGVSLLNINIRSLRKNWDNLQIAIDRSKIKWDLIVITEINIKKEELDNYKIEGYMKYAITREETKRGGGILVLINKSQKFKNINTTNLKLDGNDGIKINFEFSNELFEVIAIYRKPDSNKLKYIKELKNMLKNQEIKLKTMICLGDINIDILEDDNLEIDKSEQNVVDKYENLLAEQGFEKLINSPTRVEIVKKKNKNEYVIQKSCLDHIHIKTKKWITKGITIEEKLSDHYFTACWLWKENNLKERNKQDNMHTDKLKDNIKYNDNNIIDEMNKIKWNKLIKCSNVNDMFNEINKTIHVIYDKNIMKEKTTAHNIEKGRKKWITKETIELINKKNRMWKEIKAQENINEKMQEKYNMLKKSVNQQVAQDKQVYYKNQIEKGEKDNKTMWRVINELTGKTVNTETIDDTVKNAFKETKVKETCELFNKNFQNQVPDLKRKYTEKSKKMLTGKFFKNVECKLKQEVRVKNTMHISESTEREIEVIISNLKNTNSTGFDGIMTKHIKASKENTSRAISKLINKIIEDETWPETLKIQILRPLHKKGSKTELNNYRPISLLSVINKIIEKFFANKIKSFLTKFKLLTDIQYGYTEKRGTEQILVQINELITTALNDGKYVGAIFIDLQKAFDSFDKKILLKKCENLGIRGKIYNIINSYLTNRNAMVKIDNEYSETTNIEFGVPQGSVLGPLLFLIFTNDIEIGIDRTYLYLFADDMILISIHYSKTEMLANLQTDFDLLNCWLLKNEMYISEEKTLYMDITVPKMKKKEDSKIFIHGKNCNQMFTNMKNHDCSKTCSTLNNKSHTKYLGLTLDTNWDFKLHTRTLINKLRFLLSKIYQIKNVLNTKNKRILYYAWIESQLRYGIEVYGLASEYIINRLQHLQNKIVKVMFGNKFTKTQDIYKTEKILTVLKLRDQIIITKNYFDKKHKNYNAEKHKRLRQNSVRYELPRWSNKYGLRNKNFYIPMIFNRLTQELSNQVSIEKLKPELKNFLINE